MMAYSQNKQFLILVHEDNQFDYSKFFSVVSIINGNNWIVTQQKLSLKFYVFLKIYSLQFDILYSIFYLIPSDK